MMSAEDTDKKIQSSWQCTNVWAKPEQFDGNVVRQLIVPEGRFTHVQGIMGSLEISNEYGRWPAAPGESPLATEQVWARLVVGSKPGDQLQRAEWVKPIPLKRLSPKDVLASYRRAISFTDGTEGVPGLRPPQLGAMHAVLGYWTTNRTTPATVVMPTGTGKTETMLALLVAARPLCLLVLVPSDALRTQVAAKFETLGVLQKLGIVSSSALRPVVGQIQHRFTTASAAEDFANACNVIVTTPQALDASSPEVREAILNVCSHLFVDEAHHVAASTWAAIRAHFDKKRVVQFTATPFREDGRHLQGRILYSFPLREAQAQGYFSTIDYTGVIDFVDVDKTLAEQSVARLRDDLASGFDHVLMVRVSGIPRAREIKPYYDAIAADMQPVIINSQMAKGQQREALGALRNRQSRIIICVNMLGEGFDLPALKIAAVHDPQKSLGVTLQFIGRFARTSVGEEYGGASVFVARKDFEVDKRLRGLYAEDSDWNVVLRNLSEEAVEEQQEVSDFEEGFTSLPEEVALRSLLPKMSTVAYRAPRNEWEPQNIVEFFGEAQLLTVPIGLNAEAGVAWCVVESKTDVRWGELKTIEEVTYALYILYFDRNNRMLYINNSTNDGVFEDLAVAVLGEGASRFTGSTVYRVMADIERLVPTNVGVLDAHDRFRRFSMHVGSDVTASFSQAEAGTKSQTNISGSGFRDGDRVSISASLKGRIWSHETARSLKHWRDWCDSVGSKLLDDTISIDKVIGQFILPEPIKERPEGVLLAAEWPWEVHTRRAENIRLVYQDKSCEMAYADLLPNTDSTTGPFRFTVSTDAWKVGYEASVEKGGLVYSAANPDEEVMVVRARSETTLSAWLNSAGLLLTLNDDRIIEGNLLYRPTWEKEPFDRSALRPLSWDGISLNVESQTEHRRQDSIQFKAISELKDDPVPWDIILDDDGSGEIADVVAMRIDESGLAIRLVHCKYSHGEAPGARVADLYEVCGQAQKSVMWRRSDLTPFFSTLLDRANKKQKRTGVSPFEVGDVRKLYELRDRAVLLRPQLDIVIVQPGLSASRATTQQLDLLASTREYLNTTIKAPLAVWCSS
ncbi:DEAD/DEAH box helicase [Pseudarthrobacter phenanthrenivorans]|uniref:DEAD/DEAH box helicase n=1 Tax=Pseudarthrobacter phenanthrenivorans TaxID=361575 RepID=A0A3B0FPL9_PSEPS|nr:DEAD/DEAH box helicase family protein [Pseudarthrobacter phenanthrenivorans]RKO21849.1 DEAD/DEAH box helicase [Pseudarthrobacter phenanthrenivorans]